MLNRVLREPLLHFTVIGAVLFVVFFALNPDELEPAADPKTVVIDERNILNFLQFQMKAFDGNLVKRRFAAMKPEEKDRLVKEYIREEVLYREAQSLSLDQSDYVIKRRMIQKLDFIAEGFAASIGRPTEEYVQAHYEKNKRDYFVEPWVTFTHVFFDGKRIGVVKAEELAVQKLVELNGQKAHFSDAVKHGNRFLYHTNYVERTGDFVASHFGPQMARELFKLEPNKSQWRGPYVSQFGSHVVMLVARQKGKTPPLDEVRGRVEGDAHRALIKERTEENVKKIIESYTVEDQLIRSAPSASQAPAAQR
jgi:PPIC-type PPIASE domain